jgi:hypothetical protein
MKRIDLVAPASADELEARYRTARDPVARSQFQILWLLACGRPRGEVAAVTGYSLRWIRALIRRYNAHGPDGVGDRRHKNAGAKPLLGGEDLAALRTALGQPPPDGGLWSGPKVARWIAGRLGLEGVHAQRGWDYLRRLEWRPQVPRPRHPAAADAAARTAFQKT